MLTTTDWWSSWVRAACWVTLATDPIKDPFATLRGLPDDAFKSTAYAYANLMWSILPYLTLGLEYAYRVRWNRDGRTHDNSRFLLGVQVF